MSRFRGVRAAFVNCSLKSDAAESHTGTLLRHAGAVMEKQGVEIDTIHAREHRIAFGMRADMREHGAAHDDWPALYRRIVGADILLLGTPIWLGAKSSVCTLVVERLYSNSTDKNDRGQYVYYGKVGGCVVTGNEDGIKAVAAQLLYACSTSATRSRRPPMPDGSARPVRARATAMPSTAATCRPASTTSPPTATPPSCAST